MRNSFAAAGGGRDVVELELEEELFYESHDRILSSSCSSTSASDDDEHYQPHPHPHPHPHRRRNNSNQPSQISIASSYDVWLSEPSSVEERRRRLLQKLDLIGDPSLSRPKSALLVVSGSEGVEERSVVRDGRSRSDGSIGQCVASDLSLSITKSTSSGSYDTVDEDEEEAAGCDAGDAEDCQSHQDQEQYCTIKNLDNGEEFVVEEVKEEGAWNKLRVVGRGRQLTMEEFQNSVVGHSPIVQELLRRQNEDSSNGSGGKKDKNRGNGSRSREKKKGGWFRSIKNAAGAVVHRKERRSSDEKDTSSENGRRRSSSATDDSQDVHSHHGWERVKVRHYGSSLRELTGLYLNQEIHAHSGSIWTIKFSLDGKYLASAGEDCVIHIWQVESKKKGDSMVERGLGAVEDAAHPNPLAALNNGLSEPFALDLDRNSSEKRRAKIHGTRKSFSLEHIVIPENVFMLLEKPVRTFYGHSKDVLDLSWSSSERLLSSSMDKTVRLWDLSSSSCLKIFSHNDYVTCIQFNPVDDNHFISGSLDAKVRMWNIDKHQVVHWNELHEMVTAACFTPDGQGALVGSDKGCCYCFKTSDHKLQQKSQINLQNKKKKSHLKKITGFEYVPRSSSEVFITSADSRIRVVDDHQLVHKFKGFRNKTSQISASLTADGKHVICASEDSYVYVWRYEVDSRPSRTIGAVTLTQSYEHFHCRDVSVAVAWPGTSIDGMSRTNSNGLNEEDCLSKAYTMIAEVGNWQQDTFLPATECSTSPQHPSISPANNNHFSDRVSATWPEEKLTTTPCMRNSHSIDELSSQLHSMSAWGMVIVTAGRGGEIKIFQNFGHPVGA